jgi:hypothetical protein
VCLALVIINRGYKLIVVAIYRICFTRAGGPDPSAFFEPGARLQRCQLGC